MSEKGALFKNGIIGALATDFNLNRAVLPDLWGLDSLVQSENLKRARRVAKLLQMQSVFLIPPDTIEFKPESYFDPLDLGAIFPKRAGAPLEIDLGSGDGSFILAMAAGSLDRNFLAVERLMGRVRKTCRRTGRLGLPNLRVLRLESHYLLRHLLRRESVAVLHIMFPDPWPKRRHHHRRLIQTEFLDAAHAVLQAGGELRLTTDDQPYFLHMRKVFTAHPGFVEEPWEPGEDYPQTDFERGFRAKGLPIYRALLRKT